MSMGTYPRVAVDDVTLELVLSVVGRGDQSGQERH